MSFAWEFKSNFPRIAFAVFDGEAVFEFAVPTVIAHRTVVKVVIDANEFYLHSSPNTFVMTRMTFETPGAI